LEAILQALKFPDALIVISHSDYLTAVGGTEKLMRTEQAQYAQRRISYLQMFPLDSREWEPPKVDDWRIGLNIDSQPAGQITVSQSRRVLAALRQRGVRIAGVNIHHLMGLDVAAAEAILQGEKSPVRFFLHDFYSVCRHPNLLYNGLESCGNPPANSMACATCFYGPGRADYLAAWRSFLERRVNSIVAPSAISKAIWGRSYPTLLSKVGVVPPLTRVFHPSPVGGVIASRSASPELRIAFVGYRAWHKGWQTWRKLLEKTAANSRFGFYHIGGGHENIAGQTSVQVSPLASDGMRQALREHRIDVAFLWSICAETYSFTLYESMSVGCFVITNPSSGNIAECVRETGRGYIARDERDLFELFGDPTRLRRLIEQAGADAKPFDLAPDPSLADEAAAKLSIR
jgi:hypothetical protein